MLKLKSGQEIKTLTDYYAAFCMDCSSGLEFQFMYEIITQNTGILVKPCIHCLENNNGMLDESS